MRHDLYKTGDADAPEAIKDQDEVVVLGLCRVCGQGEIELSPVCPGQKDEPSAEWWLDYWRAKASVLEGIAGSRSPLQPVEVMAGMLAELANSIRRNVLKESR